MPYFPHPELFFAGTGLRAEDFTAGNRIEIDGGVLRKLVSMALASVEFDEAGYLDYADIKDAHDNGQIQDLSEHYRRAGFFECRFVASVDFDVDWYAQCYPDVRLALENGEISSAQQHYLEIGYKEWRLPCAAASGDFTEWRELLEK